LLGCGHDARRPEQSRWASSPRDFSSAKDQRRRRPWCSTRERLSGRSFWWLPLQLGSEWLPCDVGGAFGLLRQRRPVTKRKRGSEAQALGTAGLSTWRLLLNRLMCSSVAVVAWTGAAVIGEFLVGQRGGGAGSCTCGTAQGKYGAVLWAELIGLVKLLTNCGFNLIVIGQLSRTVAVAAHRKREAHSDGA
jgi:hypothetical protein